MTKRMVLRINEGIKVVSAVVLLAVIAIVVTVAVMALFRAGSARSAAAAAGAPTNTKSYQINCAAMWRVVLRATAVPQYHDVKVDDVAKKASFYTGGGLVSLTGRRYLDVSLSGDGDYCTVAVDAGFLGRAHGDAHEFFKRIDKTLEGGGDYRHTPETIGR